MDYRKERNFIVAYDGEKCRGKLDILTNQWYGVKGAIVKNKPTAFNTVACNAITDEAIRHLLYVFTEYGSNHSYFTADHGKRAEEVLSVGLKIECSWSTWNFLRSDHTKLSKDLISFLNEYHNGVYNERNVTLFSQYVLHQSFLMKCGDHKNWAFDVLQRVNKAVPQDFAQNMIIRGIHEKVFFDRTIGGFAELISDWHHMITQLGDKLEVKHNILTNFTILAWTYNKWKKDHYDDAIKAHNDQAWLYFEDDNFIVRPLLSREAFHLEATMQHNCVERMYMDWVYEGNTHVVTVRRKSAPDTPYITCEVDLFHTIRQYLLAFNVKVKPNTPEYDFYEKYKAHLDASLEQERES